MTHTQVFSGKSGLISCEAIEDHRESYWKFHFAWIVGPICHIQLFLWLFNKAGECCSMSWFHHGPLQWRHNGRDSVSNHQSHVCLLNRLFRRRSKKTSKLRVTGLCAGNSPHKWPVTRKMFPFDDVIMPNSRHDGDYTRDASPLRDLQGVVPESHDMS